MSLEKVMRNRQIKADRVYKTLGKMSWQRVVLGIALLCFVFVFTGTLSELYLNRGSYGTAQKLIISRQWMEEYKPEEMALIDAGAALETGDADAAYELIEDVGIAGLHARFLDEYADVCAEIAEICKALSGEEAALRAEKMTTAAQNALLTLEGTK